MTFFTIHKKVSHNVIDVLSKGRWTGWGFTDCAAIECPKCGAPKYHYCSTPKGRKEWPPHKERYNALIATGVHGKPTSRNCKNGVANYRGDQSEGKEPMMNKTTATFYEVEIEDKFPLIDRYGEVRKFATAKSAEEAVRDEFEQDGEIDVSYRIVTVTLIREWQ